jgi:hypothetical protein
MMQRQMLGLRERAVLTAVAPPIVTPEMTGSIRPKSNGRAIEPAAPTELVVAGA